MRLDSILIATLLLLSSESMASNQIDEESKLKTLSATFVKAWAKREFAAAKKLTAKSLYYCNGTTFAQPEKDAEQLSLFKKLKTNSGIKESLGVEATFLSIMKFSKAPIDKMRIDGIAKKQLRELTKPTDWLVGVVIQNPEKTNRDAMMLVCRNFAGEYKIVGILYDEPKKSK